MLPAIKYLLKDSVCGELKTVEEELDALEDVHALISKAIVDEPPMIVREGGIIKDCLLYTSCCTHRRAPLHCGSWHRRF